MKKKKDYSELWREFVEIDVFMEDYKYPVLSCDYAKFNSMGQRKREIRAIFRRLNRKAR